MCLEIKSQSEMLHVLGLSLRDAVWKQTLWLFSLNKLVPLISTFGSIKFLPLLIRDKFLGNIATLKINLQMLLNLIHA